MPAKAATAWARSGAIRRPAWHQGRAHPLAPPVVGHTEDADVGHLLGLGEHGLDFCRIDVHAAGDDEVVAATVDEEVAVTVEVAEVAHREEAVPPRLLRLSSSPQ